MLPFMSLAIPRPSLVEQAAETLRGALQEGLWRDQMPGERNLSRQLNISRPTLRAALEVLRAEGWVKVLPGRQRAIVKRPVGFGPGRSQTIRVLTPLPMQEVPPFALCWMDRLRELLARVDLQLEIHSGRRWYSRRPEQDLAALTRQAPAAAWLLFMTNARMQRWFAASGRPAILCGSCHSGIDLPSVDFDYRAVCRHAAGQFLRRGHRRIVLLMEASDTAGDRESEAGFAEAFGTKAGTAATPMVVRHGGTPETIRQCVRGLLGHAASPTAFLVARSMPALLTASELIRQGRRVPENAAVIARDSDHFHEYFSPQLARYCADPEVHARRLTRIVTQLARGAMHGVMRTRIVPKFFPGESLGGM
jgi:DNA-binding LacI/PurR family transcriptional regulator